MNVYLFFFKQKTAYEMRISDWSSDVCSSDLDREDPRRFGAARRAGDGDPEPGQGRDQFAAGTGRGGRDRPGPVGDRAVLLPAALAIDEIGRASCRARVCQYV